MPVLTSLELEIERPAVGGRMLARHEGLVVFVAGAIPGERVRVHVERVSRNVIWAETVEVLRPSPSRRATDLDLACGGQVYAHIRYEDQPSLKAQVIADAMRRIGKVSLQAPLVVASPVERGYRLRARLHVRHGTVGFFREGSHTICDAGLTGQLFPSTVAAVRALVERLGPDLSAIDAVVIAENVRATKRLLHIELRAGVNFEIPPGLVDALPGVDGITMATRSGSRSVQGEERVTDSADELFAGASPVDVGTRWSRRAASFFQGNRYLVGALTRAVIDLARGDRIADLYAGVGLFTVACAARGNSVVAVEGDPISADDLLFNVFPYGPRVRVIVESVEHGAKHLDRGDIDTVILDPPRTGMSPEALGAVLRLEAPRLVYVSCDPATLARDTARLIASGYEIDDLRAFDLFPNTAHVEVVVAFERGLGGLKT